jgi:hypothetical protein
MFGAISFSALDVQVSEIEKSASSCKRKRPGWQALSASPDRNFFFDELI